MPSVREHCIGNAASVALYGYDRPTSNRSLALIHGAKKDAICLIKAPGSADKPGFKTITEPRFGLLSSNEPDVCAEGVVLTEPGSAAVITTADCPTLVMYEKRQKRLIVTHAGRPAMTPTKGTGEALENIVSIAYDILVGEEQNPIVFAYITGAICGHCFVHEGPDDEKFVAPFDYFGDVAFTNRKRGGLDLVSVISHQLIELGVQSNRIQHDELCTMESHSLVSFRRDRSDERNAIVVTLFKKD